jgi:hypothetical protein
MPSTEIMLAGLVWLLVVAVFLYNRHRAIRGEVKGKPSFQPQRCHD